MKIPAELVQRHDRLIENLEKRAGVIRSRYAGQMQCGRGCALCCRGLFDISIFDALFVAKGFASLAAQTGNSVIERAAAIHGALMKLQPDLAPPFFLDGLAPDRIDEIADRIGAVRCPFLDAGDACLIYEYRPVACRLEGLPMVDLQDGLFGDWCALNFRQGVDEAMKRDLALDYYEIQSIEQDTAIFIPSVLQALANGQGTLFSDR